MNGIIRGDALLFLSLAHGEARGRSSRLQNRRMEPADKRHRPKNEAAHGRVRSVGDVLRLFRLCGAWGHARRQARCLPIRMKMAEAATRPAGSFPAETGSVPGADGMQSLPFSAQSRLPWIPDLKDRHLEKGKKRKTAAYNAAVFLCPAERVSSVEIGKLHFCERARRRPFTRPQKGRRKALGSVCGE